MPRTADAGYAPRHAAAPAPGAPPDVAPPDAASPVGTALLVTRVAVTALLMAAATTLLSLFTWTLLPFAVGWSPSVVLTGSMLPSVRPGDIVVTAPIDTARLQLGHVIRFVDPARPSRYLLHRISRTQDNGTFITRGDANGNDDSTPVPTGNVTGVARLRVPLVGLPVVWLREGEYVALGLAAVGVLGTMHLVVGFRNGVLRADDDPADDQADDQAADDGAADDGAADDGAHDDTDDTAAEGAPPRPRGRHRAPVAEPEPIGATGT